MKFQQAITTCWIVAFYTLFGVIVWQSWQQLPIFGDHPTLSYLQWMGISMGIMLKPGILIPWIVLVSTGIFWTWKRRSMWRTERGILYLFVAFSFSVIWFIVSLIVLRYKAGTN